MRTLRLMALGAGLSLALAGTSHAAPLGTLKQHKLPAGVVEPRAIENGPDGNRWFTSGFGNNDALLNRITPAGAVTSFPGACDFCILTDLKQADDGTLYYTSNDPFLGSFNPTTGVYGPHIENPGLVGTGGALALHGDQAWVTDSFTGTLWRYDFGDAAWEDFPTGVGLSDVEVDAGGRVWFTAPNDNLVGELLPDGSVVTTPTTLAPRDLTVDGDGHVWFTSRFPPQGVGRLIPGTPNAVSEWFTGTGGPSAIDASPDGTVWFTQEVTGNIARVDDNGVITEAKAVKNSTPLGIVVDPEGDPWYTMLDADKVAELQVRR